MSTWKQDRETEFNALLSEWGTKLQRNSLEADCEKTPDAVDYTMTQGPYVTRMKSTFDIARTEWTRLGMTGTRTQFTCEGKTWEIIRVRDDSADYSIQFDATRAI